MFMVYLYDDIIFIFLIYRDLVPRNEVYLRKFDALVLSYPSSSSSITLSVILFVLVFVRFVFV